VSLALAGLFFLAEPVVAGSQPLWGLAKYLAYTNFALALFNLIPGYPLDGGRVFRAIVWAATQNMRRATLIAANTGRFFGFLFILFGVWSMFRGNFGGGLWIAFIGWFLESAASAQVRQETLQGSLAGHTVSQAMSSHCATINADLTLQELVDEHILGGGQRCFLVTRGADTIGMITLHRIKEVPRQDWPSTTAAQVMLPFDKLKRTGPDTPLWTALQQMDRDGVNQLPVTRDNQVLGMLSRDGVVTYLRTLQELGT
jgi:CBS domain-containing protein